MLRWRVPLHWYLAAIVPLAAVVATAAILDTGYRGALGPLVLPGFVVGIFAGAIVLTWLYEGSGASVLLAALWHTSLNLGSATEAGAGYTPRSSRCS